MKTTLTMPETISEISRMRLVKALMIASVVTSSKSIRMLAVTSSRAGEPKTITLVVLHLILIREAKEPGISMSLMLVDGAQWTEEVILGFRVMLRANSIDLALIVLNLEVDNQIMRELWAQVTEGHQAVASTLQAWEKAKQLITVITQMLLIGMKSKSFLTKTRWMKTSETHHIQLLICKEYKPIHLLTMNLMMLPTKSTTIRMLISFLRKAVQFPRGLDKCRARCLCLAVVAVEHRTVSMWLGHKQVLIDQIWGWVLKTAKEEQTPADWVQDMAMPVLREATIDLNQESNHQWMAKMLETDN